MFPIQEMRDLRSEMINTQKSLDKACEKIDDLVKAIKANTKALKAKGG